MARLFPAQKGSLYRRLVLSFTTFVLMALVALVAWLSWWDVRESRRRFEQLAVTNAEFIDQMPLPRSRQMAERLSSILGVEVGFSRPGGVLVRSSGDAWPGKDALASLGETGVAVVRVDGHDLARAPLREAGHALVLSRVGESGLAGLGAAALVPALILTLTCGAFGFLMAHRIVRPLALLTDWLPNLQGDRQAAGSVPEKIGDRTDEIGQLARSLADTHQRLLDEQVLRQRSERLATLGRIATSLAHEIRNPAAAIRMHADLLERADEAGRLESISLIGEEVDRITDLVNQWLFVARAAPPEKRPHDLGAVVAAVARRLQPALDHAGVRMVPPEPGATRDRMVDCDRLRIEQVVRNLVVNAVQAMPGGGEVVLVLRPRGDRVELVVSDSGKGFSDEALRRFGEPFFSEREGGMGIGLTLAREVVEAHGGGIEASNPDQGGGEVRVSLPVSTKYDES